MASFTNFATLSYNGGTTNSNTVTGELLEALTVTKTAVVKNYAANALHAEKRIIFAGVKLF